MQTKSLWVALVVLLALWCFTAPALASEAYDVSAAEFSLCPEGDSACFSALALNTSELSFDDFTFTSVKNFMTNTRSDIKVYSPLKIEWDCSLPGTQFIQIKASIESIELPVVSNNLPGFPVSFNTNKVTSGGIAKCSVETYFLATANVSLNAGNNKEHSLKLSFVNQLNVDTPIQSTRTFAIRYKSKASEVPSLPVWSVDAKKCPEPSTLNCGHGLSTQKYVAIPSQLTCVKWVDNKPHAFDCVHAKPVLKSGQAMIPTFCTVGTSRPDSTFDACEPNLADWRSSSWGCTGAVVSANGFEMCLKDWKIDAKEVGTVALSVQAANEFTIEFTAPASTSDLVVKLAGVTLTEDSLVGNVYTYSFTPSTYINTFTFEAKVDGANTPLYTYEFFHAASIKDDFQSWEYLICGDNGCAAPVADPTLNSICGKQVLAVAKRTCYSFDGSSDVVPCPFKAEYQPKAFFAECAASSCSSCGAVAMGSTASLFAYEPGFGLSLDGKEFSTVRSTIPTQTHEIYPADCACETSLNGIAYDCAKMAQTSPPISAFTSKTKPDWTVDPAPTTCDSFTAKPNKVVYTALTGSPSAPNTECSVTYTPSQVKAYGKLCSAPKVELESFGVRKFCTGCGIPSGQKATVSLTIGALVVNQQITDYTVTAEDCACPIQLVDVWISATGTNTIATLNGSTDLLAPNTLYNITWACDPLNQIIAPSDSLLVTVMIKDSAGQAAPRVETFPYRYNIDSESRGFAICSAPYTTPQIPYQFPEFSLQLTNLKNEDPLKTIAPIQIGAAPSRRGFMIDSFAWYSRAVVDSSLECGFTDIATQKASNIQCLGLTGVAATTQAVALCGTKPTSAPVRTYAQNPECSNDGAQCDLASRQCVCKNGFHWNNGKCASFGDLIVVSSSSQTQHQIAHDKGSRVHVKWEFTPAPNQVLEFAIYFRQGEKSLVPAIDVSTSPLAALSYHGSTRQAYVYIPAELKGKGIQVHVFELNSGQSLVNTIDVSAYEWTVVLGPPLSPICGSDWSTDICKDTTTGFQVANTKCTGTRPFVTATGNCGSYGTCIDNKPIEKPSKCQCNTGFTGDNCQIAPTFTNLSAQIPAHVATPNGPTKRYGQYYCGDKVTINWSFQGAETPVQIFYWALTPEGTRTGKPALLAHVLDGKKSFDVVIPESIAVSASAHIIITFEKKDFTKGNVAFDPLLSTQMDFKNICKVHYKCSSTSGTPIECTSFEADFRGVFPGLSSNSIKKDTHWWVQDSTVDLPLTSYASQFLLKCDQEIKARVQQFWCYSGSQLVEPQFCGDFKIAQPQAQTLTPRCPPLVGQCNDCNAAKTCPAYLTSPTLSADLAFSLPGASCNHLCPCSVRCKKTETATAPAAECKLEDVNDIPTHFVVADASTCFNVKFTRNVGCYRNMAAIPAYRGAVGIKNAVGTTLDPEASTGDIAITSGNACKVLTTPFLSSFPSVSTQPSLSNQQGFCNKPDGVCNVDECRVKPDGFSCTLNLATAGFTAAQAPAETIKGSETGTQGCFIPKNFCDCAAPSISAWVATRFSLADLANARAGQYDITGLNAGKEYELAWDCKRFFPVTEDGQYALEALYQATPLTAKVSLFTTQTVAFRDDANLDAAFKNVAGSTDYSPAICRAKFIAPDTATEYGRISFSLKKAGVVISSSTTRHALPVPAVITTRVWTYQWAYRCPTPPPAECGTTFFPDFVPQTNDAPDCTRSDGFVNVQDASVFCGTSPDPKQPQQCTTLRNNSPGARALVPCRERTDSDSKTYCSVDGTCQCAEGFRYDSGYCRKIFNLSINKRNPQGVYDLGPVDLNGVPTQSVSPGEYVRVTWDIVGDSLASIKAVYQKSRELNAFQYTPSASDLALTFYQPDGSGFAAIPRVLVTTKSAYIKLPAASDADIASLSASIVIFTEVDGKVDWFTRNNFKLEAKYFTWQNNGTACPAMKCGGLAPLARCLSKPDNTVVADSNCHQFKPDAVALCATSSAVTTAFNACIDTHQLQCLDAKPAEKDACLAIALQSCYTKFSAGSDSFKCHSTNTFDINGTRCIENTCRCRPGFQGDLCDQAVPVQSSITLPLFTPEKPFKCGSALSVSYNIVQSEQEGPWELQYNNNKIFGIGSPGSGSSLSPVSTLGPTPIIIQLVGEFGPIATETIAPENHTCSYKWQCFDVAETEPTLQWKACTDEMRALTHVSVINDKSVLTLGDYVYYKYPSTRCVDQALNLVKDSTLCVDRPVSSKPIPIEPTACPATTAAQKCTLKPIIGVTFPVTMPTEFNCALLCDHVCETVEALDTSKSLCSRQAYTVTTTCKPSAFSLFVEQTEPVVVVYKEDATFCGTRDVSFPWATHCDGPALMTPTPLAPQCTVGGHNYNCPVTLAECQASFKDQLPSNFQLSTATAIHPIQTQYVRGHNYYVRWQCPQTTITGDLILTVFQNPLPTDDVQTFTTFSTTTKTVSHRALTSIELTTCSALVTLPQYGVSALWITVEWLPAGATEPQLLSTLGQAARLYTNHLVAKPNTIIQKDKINFGTNTVAQAAYPEFTAGTYPSCPQPVCGAYYSQQMVLYTSLEVPTTTWDFTAVGQTATVGSSLNYPSDNQARIIPLLCPAPAATITCAHIPGSYCHNPLVDQLAVETATVVTGTSVPIDPDLFQWSSFSFNYVSSTFNGFAYGSPSDNKCVCPMNATPMPTADNIQYCSFLAEAPKLVSLLDAVGAGTKYTCATKLVWEYTNPSHFVQINSYDVDGHDLGAQYFPASEPLTTRSFFAPTAKTFGVSFVRKAGAADTATNDPPSVRFEIAETCVAKQWCVDSTRALVACQLPSQPSISTPTQWFYFPQCSSNSCPQWNSDQTEWQTLTATGVTAWTPLENDDLQCGKQYTMLAKHLGCRLEADGLLVSGCDDAFTAQLDFTIPCKSEICAACNGTCEPVLTFGSGSGVTNYNFAAAADHSICTASCQCQTSCSTTSDFTKRVDCNYVPSADDFYDEFYAVASATCTKVSLNRYKFQIYLDVDVSDDTDFALVFDQNDVVTEPLSVDVPDFCQFDPKTSCDACGVPKNSVSCSGTPVGFGEAINVPDCQVGSAADACACASYDYSLPGADPQDPPTLQVNQADLTDAKWYSQCKKDATTTKLSDHFNITCFVGAVDDVNRSEVTCGADDGDNEYDNCVYKCAHPDQALFDLVGDKSTMSYNLETTSFGSCDADYLRPETTICSAWTPAVTERQQICVVGASTVIACPGTTDPETEFESKSCKTLCTSFTEAPTFFFGNVVELSDNMKVCEATSYAESVISKCTNVAANTIRTHYCAIPVKDSSPQTYTIIQSDICASQTQTLTTIEGTHACTVGCYVRRYNDNETEIPFKLDGAQLVQTFTGSYDATELDHFVYSRSCGQNHLREFAQDPCRKEQAAASVRGTACIVCDGTNCSLSETDCSETATQNALYDLEREKWTSADVVAPGGAQFCQTSCASQTYFNTNSADFAVHSNISLIQDADVIQDNEDHRFIAQCSDNWLRTEKDYCWDADETKNTIMVNTVRQSICGYVFPSYTQGGADVRVVTAQQNCEGSTLTPTWELAETGCTQELRISETTDGVETWLPLDQATAQEKLSPKLCNRCDAAYTPPMALLDGPVACKGFYNGVQFDLDFAQCASVSIPAFDCSCEAKCLPAESSDWASATTCADDIQEQWKQAAFCGDIQRRDYRFKTLSGTYLSQNDANCVGCEVEITAKLTVADLALCTNTLESFPYKPAELVGRSGSDLESAIDDILTRSAVEAGKNDAECQLSTELDCHAPIAFEYVDVIQFKTKNSDQARPLLLNQLQNEIETAYDLTPGEWVVPAAWPGATQGKDITCACAPKLLCFRDLTTEDALMTIENLIDLWQPFPLADHYGSTNVDSPLGDCNNNLGAFGFECGPRCIGTPNFKPHDRQLYCRTSAGGLKTVSSPADCDVTIYKDNTSAPQGTDAQCTAAVQCSAEFHCEQYDPALTDQDITRDSAKCADLIPENEWTCWPTQSGATEPERCTRDVDGYYRKKSRMIIVANDIDISTTDDFLTLNAWETKNAAPIVAAFKQSAQTYFETSKGSETPVLSFPGCVDFRGCDFAITAFNFALCTDTACGKTNGPAPEEESDVADASFAVTAQSFTKEIIINDDQTLDFSFEYYGPLNTAEMNAVATGEVPEFDQTIVFEWSYASAPAPTASSEWFTISTAELSPFELVSGQNTLRWTLTKDSVKYFLLNANGNVLQNTKGFIRARITQSATGLTEDVSIANLAAKVVKADRCELICRGPNYANSSPLPGVGCAADKVQGSWVCECADAPYNDIIFKAGSPSCTRTATCEAKSTKCANGGYLAWDNQLHSTHECESTCTCPSGLSSATNCQVCERQCDVTRGTPRDEGCGCGTCLNERVTGEYCELCLVDYTMIINNPATSIDAWYDLTTARNTPAKLERARYENLLIQQLHLQYTQFDQGDISVSYTKSKIGTVSGVRRLAIVFVFTGICPAPKAATTAFTLLQDTNIVAASPFDGMDEAAWSDFLTSFSYTTLPASETSQFVSGGVISPTAPPVTPPVVEPPVVVPPTDDDDDDEEVPPPAEEPANEEPTKKKSHTTTIVLAVVIPIVALVIIAILVWFFFFKDKSAGSSSSGKNKSSVTPAEPADLHLELA